MYFSSISSHLCLYDINSWDLKKSYGCYDGILRNISWSDDSKYILQVNSKGFIEILSAADHDVRSLQHIPVKDTWSATFHRDGHRNIAIGTKSGNVMIWDTKTKSVTKTFPTPSQKSSVNFVSYNPKNTILAATMENGDTVIYGLASNIPVSTVTLSCSKSISSMKFHHDCRSLLGLATEEGHIVLRDITTNKDKIFFKNVHDAPISDFAYSLVNKNVFLSCGYDKVVHIYDVRMRYIVSTIKTTNILTSVDLNDNSKVALGTKNGLTLIYDLRKTYQGFGQATDPFKLLKGHEQEVRCVAFQPSRKDIISTDSSLHEDNIVNMSPHDQSPGHKRTSNMFSNSDTLPKNNINLDLATQGETTADSFLVMMGLDKTNNDFDNNVNISECEIKREIPVGQSHQSGPEKNISMESSPVNSRIDDNFGFLSTIKSISNGLAAEGGIIKQTNRSGEESAAGVSLNTEAMDDLKNFIKLNIADVADDNRNFFLHLMMALTKQDIYLKKQLTAINVQLQNLAHKQKVLEETNIKMGLQLDELKARNNMSYK